MAVLVPGQAVGQTSALWRSLLVPGTGQAHQGNYQKAALFAGAALLSGVGLFLTVVHYNQAVDRYRDSRAAYLDVENRLGQGEVVNIGEINGLFAQTESSWNDAEDRLVWRNVFLVSFIGVYALNIVDVLLSRPHDVETAGNFQIDVDRERVLVSRALVRF